MSGPNTLENENSFSLVILQPPTSARKESRTSAAYSSFNYRMIYTMIA